MPFLVPWLSLAIAIPLVAAFVVRFRRDADESRRISLIAGSLTLACTLVAWASFSSFGSNEAHDRFDLGLQLADNPLWVIDGLSAPLLPLVALLYLLTLLATLRTKVRRFSFAGQLASESLLLATLSCRHPWVIIGLLAAATIPPWAELRLRRQSTRIFTLHMALFVLLLIAGQWLIAVSPGDEPPSIVGIGLLIGAVLVRSGAIPVHGWMTNLFENAAFGTSLLFVTPMVGAYAAMRLVLPIAPEWTLHAIAVVSVVTAIYAAGMALVQRDARRFFCYIFLSHSSLVFVGLETVTTIGLTGALCAWFSISLSMTGFGLTLRSIEARTGPLSLEKFHGLYEHTPRLAALFLVTGLASIGFPGTVGFIGGDLLVEGAVQLYPLIGMAVVIVAGLNGIAVLHAYFRVFTGTRHHASIDLHLRTPERIAVLILIALVIGGGLYPQPGVLSRYHAATELIEQRQVTADAQPKPLGVASPAPLTVGKPGA